MAEEDILMTTLFHWHPICNTTPAAHTLCWYPKLYLHGELLINAEALLLYKESFRIFSSVCNIKYGSAQTLSFSIEFDF